MSFSSSPDSAATVNAIYAGRTDIFDDSPSGKVYLQLRDTRFNAGNALITTVTITAVGNTALSNAVQTVSFTCHSSPYCSRAVGADLLPAAWFDASITGAVVTLSYGIEHSADTVLTTLTLNSRSGFVLSPRSNGPSQNINNDVMLILPNREFYPGETFQAYLDAHVGLRILTFKFTMALSQYLTVDSIATDTAIYKLFAPPDSGSQNFTSSLLLLTTFDFNAFPPARLITINLRLHASAPVNVLHTLACQVIELKNVEETLAPIRNLTDVDGNGIYPQSVTFVDRAGVSALREGQVFAVASTFAGGVLVYDAQGADFINNAILERSTQMYTLDTQFACTNGNLGCTQELTCTSSAPSVLQVDGSCAHVFMNGSEVSGAEQVNVNATLVENSLVVATVPFRVWFPVLPVTVAVTDPVLDRIPGWKTWNGSVCLPRFQCSTVMLLVTYIVGDLSVLVDVSQYYKDKVTSSAPTVASFDASTGLVTGLASGSAVLSFENGGLSFGNTTVSVGNGNVSVSRLELRVITSTELTLNPNKIFSTAERYGSKEARMTFYESLVAENQQAYVYAHAVFSDNTIQRLTTAGADGLVLYSTDERIFTFDNMTQKLTLLGFSGAGEFLHGDLFGSSECGTVTPLATVKYFVNVTINPPTDVALNVESTSLTYLHESLSAYYPNAQVLNVALTFQDTPNQDMTTDSRTIFDTSSANGLFTVEFPGGFPTITANETAGVSGTGVLRVKFAHFAIFKEIFVTLVVVTASSLSSFSYPVNSGVELILSKYDNTNEFQQARLVFQLTFSDGAIKDVSTSTSSIYTVFETGSRTVNSTLITATRIVTVNSCCGVLDIYAKYNGKHETSVPVTMNVSSDPTPLVLLSGLSLSPEHLVGFAGAKSSTPTVTATFGDGSRRTITPGILPGMLTFVSSLPGKATVNAGTGVLTLQANHDDYVTLTATSMGNTSVDTTVSFATNLDPGVGDVDLGFDVLPLDAKPAGSTFDVLVRVNTGGTNTLNAIQLVVDVDFSRVAYVTFVNHVGPGSFAVVPNPDENLVEITATPSTAITGAKRDVATLTFQVLPNATGFLSFSGTTKTLKTPSGVAIIPSGTAFVAGVITMRITTSRRRQSMWSLGAEDNLFADSIQPIFSPHRSRRGTQECSSSPPCDSCVGGARETGDADGNCIFDVADANFVGLYQNAPFDVKTYQLANLDADLSGVIDLIDAAHLFNVAATFSFFLVKDSITVTNVTSASNCFLEISVQLLERHDVPAKQTGNSIAYLYLDIENGASSFTADFDDPVSSNSPPGSTFGAVVSDLGVFTGVGSAVTPNPKSPRSSSQFHGGLWEASYQANGIFKVSVFTSIVQANVGVSFIGVTTSQGNFDSPNRIKGFFPLLPKTVEPFEYPVLGLENIALTVGLIAELRIR